VRRAVRLGDGFFGAGSSPTGAFREQVAIAGDEAARQGKAGFPIAKRVYIAVDDDGARARERLSSSLAMVYGRRVPAIEAAGIAGTPDDCVTAVREVIDAGAGMVLFTALDDLLGQAERIAAEVIPAL